jgi:hypothetical protein
MESCIGLESVEVDCGPWMLLPYAAFIVETAVLLHGSRKESLDLNDGCTVFSSVNIAKFGKSSSGITSSIYESAREPGYFSRAAATVFQDRQLGHRVHDLFKCGCMRMNSQWQLPKVC